MKTLITIGALILYGIVHWFICCVQPVEKALVYMQFLNFITFVVAILALMRPFKAKTITTCLVVLALGVMPVTVPQKAKATPIHCVIALTVIVVGVVIIYGMQKLCKLIPKPENPPPPPPGAPTNAAPDIRVQADITALPVIKADADVAECYDVSDYNFVNKDPYNLPYTKYFSFFINSSTNLINWGKECRVQGWVSDLCVLTLYSSPSGQPWYTNINFLGNDNPSPFTLPGQVAARGKFFKASTY